MRDKAFTRPHVQAHDDGLPQGHRGHAQPVRVLEDVLRPLVPPRAHDDHRRGRRRSREDVRPRREVLERLEEGRQDPADPAGAAREGPGRRARPWPSDTLPWVVVAFHGPAFSETKKDLPALDALFDLTFGPTSDLYKKLVEKEQKVDSFQPNVDVNEDPELVGVFARLKKGTDPVNVRDEILEAVAAAPRRARRREASRRGEVELPLRPRARPRRHGAHRRAACALRAAAPLVRHDQRVLPPHRRRSRRPTSRPRRGRISRTRTSSSRRSRRTRCPRHGGRAAARQLRRRRQAGRRRADVAWIEQKSPLPRARGQAHVRRRLRAGPGGQGRPRRPHGAHDRGRRVAGPEDRRDQEGPLPRRGQLRLRRRPRDDDLHRASSTRTPGRRSPDVALPQLVAPGFREETSAASRTP